MEIVANHLQKEALSRTGVNERDCFGRTVFNRYYYATFLDVRTSLSELDSNWAILAHASIPELLRGTIKKILNRGKVKALKNSDTELVKLCIRALSATESLANLLDQGRVTRVTADYHPEIPVDFTSAVGFSLNTISVSDAQAWPHKARALAQTITSAWKQVHD